MTVQLKAKGETVAGKTLTLTAEKTDNDGNWIGTFTDLPKYAENGSLITYTVEETEVPEGYTATQGNADNNYTITNKHTPATTSISVTKDWNDNDNQDNKRPEKITVNLYAGEGDEKVLEDSKTVTSDENGNWGCTFTDLPKYADGEEIAYTVEEATVDGYSSSVVKNEDGSFTITNTETTSISVTKDWNDNDNQDNKRPEKITVNLYAGEGDEKELKDSKAVTPDGNENWGCTFTDLPKYADGEEIIYTVDEERVEGYISSVADNKDGSFTITNTETTSISVTKEWDDDNDRDKIRPDSVTVKLMVGTDVKGTLELNESNKWTDSFTNLPKYENGVEINYSVKEVETEDLEGYTAKVESTENGFVITNSYNPGKVNVQVWKFWDDNNNQDNIRPDSVTINLLANGEPVASKKVTAEDGWTWTFENLDKNSQGKEIKYTITEDPVAGYSTEVTGNAKDGFIITNSHTPEKIEKIAGSKTWVDNDNEDGIRPKSITINLLADGVKVDSKVVTAEDGWTWTFENLDKNSQGKEIVYTISENPVAGYTTRVDGYNVTNTHTPEKTVVSGSKTWDDADNQDNKRPESITINLLANGKKVASKVVTAKNGWKWSFTNLPKYENGRRIVYTITEEAVEGYTAKVDGYDVTNSYDPEMIDEIAGSKTWVDNDNQDGKRPESITIRLYADGVEVASKVVTAEDGWAWSFTNLPKFNDGVEIVYTIAEDAVEDYITSVEGFNVTNSHDPEMIDEIAGGKTWDDSDNQDGIRPESITINLLANGQTVATQVVTAENGWTWSFTKLPKYENGVEIVYTIAEEAVEGYIASTDGFNLTNIHVAETIDEIAGSKTWKDDNNSGKTRPESITIRLLADGNEVATQVVTADDQWSWSFTKLPKYAAGKEIVYTIVEDAVKGYTAKVDGYNVTNTLDNEEVPKTGDPRSDLQRTMLYLGMTFLMLGTACVVASMRKRKTNR